MKKSLDMSVFKLGALKKALLTAALFVFALACCACGSSKEDIKVVVSGHKTTWKEDEGVYEIVNRAGELSAVVVPDTTGEATKEGWKRTGKETVFTLYLNPKYRSDRIEMTADGIDLLPLTLGTTEKCAYFTKTDETFNSAVVASYRVEKVKKGNVKIAFNVEEQKMSPACWRAYSVLCGELDGLSDTGVTVFKKGYEEVKKGDTVNGMIFGTDFSIVADMREPSKAQLIKIEKGATSIRPFSLKKTGGKQIAEIEGVPTEFRMELGSLVLIQSPADSAQKTTVMRFEKTPE